MILFSIPNRDAISFTELFVSSVYSFVSLPVSAACLAKFLPFAIAMIDLKKPISCEADWRVAL